MKNQTIFMKHLIDHLYLGVILTLVYVVASPMIIEWGYPALTALLFIEIAVLAPMVSLHLWYSHRQFQISDSIEQVILFKEKIGVKSFLIWMIVGVVAINLVYIPLYPVGIFIREEFFGWLPEWYFNPSYGVTDQGLLASVFLAGILIDGIIGPVAEELFFRGYLLPRMTYLKSWAPIVNGALFGIYHFWQPHNLIALIGVGIILSYIVWKTKNVYLGMAIHCLINILGAVGGYYAVTNGIMIER